MKWRDLTPKQKLRRVASMAVVFVLVSIGTLAVMVIAAKVVPQ
ncbi:hypothetical protein [Rubrivivax gelatinosus]|nr:hypothetical protein [Rubrivivax gelatinosus]MBG6083027.1 hypothetical protein [Rubrivivax gelatinosus]